MGADALLGNDICHADGEAFGESQQFMFDMASGHVAHAIRSFCRQFSLGDKFLAVLSTALALDTANKRFTLEVWKAVLKGLLSLQADRWPSVSDKTRARGAHALWGTAYQG